MIRGLWLSLYIGVIIDQPGQHFFMNQEYKRFLYSFVLPLLFVVILWLIRLGEYYTQTDLSYLGILPQSVKGIMGILTSPFIHGSFKHISANSIPLIVLGGCLLFFYRDLAIKVFILIWLMSGIWVWAGARESFHIGASGLIYGLASFLFFSGVIRREIKLLSIALLVIFLYGSLVWGAIPDFLPEKNISWESHLGGTISGLILAIIYRKQGPQRKIYEWEDEEDDGEESEQNHGDDYIYTNTTDDSKYIDRAE